MEFFILDHIIAFFLLVILPMMSMRSGELTVDLSELLPPKKHIYYTNGLTLIIGSLIILTAWNISDRPWSDLGLQWPIINEQVIYSVIAVIFFYIADLIIGFMNNNKMQQIEEMSFVIPLNKGEFKHYIFLAFAAGICEEIIFRGFLVNYLLQWDDHIYYVEYVAILVPALVFAVSHLYQGIWAVLKILIVAILFGVIFWYSKSLLLVVVLHVLVDLISGLVSWLSYPKDLNKSL